MPARFEKANEDSTFDGFDSGFFNLFQMVPVGGTREMQVITDPVAGCELSVQNPLVADLTNFVLKVGTETVFPRPRFFGVPQNSAALPPNTRAQFEINGLQVGTTELILDEGPGRSRSSMRISVKQQLQRTYSLLFLADRVRATARPKAQVLEGMRRVELTYLQQANLKLVRLGAPTDVKLLDDLGDPIILNLDHMKQIVKKTPLQFFGPDNIKMYFTWDLGVGSDDPEEDVGFAPISRVCFIDDDGNIGTFAHELGHALKLHHNLNPTRLMFFQNHDGRTSKLDQGEIDTINPTGTSR